MAKNETYGTNVSLTDRLKNKGWVIVLIGAALVLLGQQFLLRRPSGAVPVGTTAPDFRLQTLDGQSIALSSLHGKVVLIDFWASWCGPCVRKLPTLKALSQKYAQQGLSILAVNMDEPHNELRAFAKQHEMTIPVLLDGGATAVTYGVRVLPHVVLIDRAGKVQFVQSGTGSSAALHQAVSNALAVAAAVN